MDPIKPGDPLPDIPVIEYIDRRMYAHSLRDLFRGRTGILLGVPGAFTPTCSSIHLPGYIDHYPAFVDAGVELIVCIAVNDPFVMNAWSKALGALGKIRLLADPRAEVTQALGMGFDASDRLGSLRCKRCSMIIEDGIVRVCNREQGGEIGCSLAAPTLEQLFALKNPLPFR